MLELTGVDVAYGDVRVIHGLSLQVPEGKIVALLGRNGAGKTTTLSAISQLIRPSGGTVRFDGRDITRARPRHLVELGLVLVPEGRRVFAPLTVRENLQLGGHLVRNPTELAKRIDQVYDLFPRLAERRDQWSGTLSGGEQQMLAIGRALVARPRLLMLDEPSMGLAPRIVTAVMQVIRDINAEGTSVLLVEQNAHAALKIAHYGYVLESGATVLAGTSATLSGDRRVMDTYLGGTSD